jgi:hypothetical protein
MINEPGQIFPQVVFNFGSHNDTGSVIIGPTEAPTEDQYVIVIKMKRGGLFIGTDQGIYMHSM